MRKNKKYKPDLLRKLARSDKWQLLYARAKDTYGIKLFRNTRDFSPLQLLFLRWLEIYHQLYTEKVLGEDLLDDEVIKDDILCDAYLLWKSKKKRKEQKEKEKEHIDLINIPTVKFV